MTFSAEWPYLLLHHVPGLGPKTLQRAQQFITNPSHLLVQDADFWQNKVRLPLAGWQAIAQWQQHPQQSDLYQNAARDAEWQAAAPIHHIIHRHHADYPPQLAVLHDPPNLLYIRGAVAARKADWPPAAMRPSGRMSEDFALRRRCGKQKAPSFKLGSSTLMHNSSHQLSWGTMR